MADMAKVSSIDAIREFRGSLLKFAEAAGNALTEADSQMQRTLGWLQSEQTSYWKAEIRRRSEQVTAARQALSSRKVYGGELQTQHSFVDEERALRTAIERHSEAEAKLERTRRWATELQKEVLLCRGQTQGLMQAVESDVPRAVARLDRTIEALEGYLAVAPQKSGELESAVSRAGPDAVGSMSVAATDGQSLRDVATGRLKARDLRGLIPLAAPLGAGALSEPPLPDRAIDVSDLRRLGSLLFIADEPKSGDRVWVAPGSARAGRVALVRVTDAASGDSGWRVTPVDEPVEPSQWRAASAERVLQVRPDWRGVLRLPRGYVVLLENGAVAAVFNAQDAQVWSSGAGRS